MSKFDEAAARLTAPASDEQITEALLAVGVKRVIPVHFHNVRKLMNDRPKTDPGHIDASVPRYRTMHIYIRDNAKRAETAAKLRSLADIFEQDGLASFELNYDGGGRVMMLDPYGDRTIDGDDYIHGYWDVMEMDEE